MNFDRDVAFSNKIRIIDLLNKIANGEETPNKFKYDNLTFTKRCDGAYFDNDGDELHSSLSIDLSNLNDEIEIIEEDKKIQNIPLSYVVCKSDFEDMHIVDVLNNFFQANDAIINELIDKVNNMENNK